MPKSNAAEVPTTILEAQVIRDKLLSDKRPFHLIVVEDDPDIRYMVETVATWHGAAEQWHISATNSRHSTDLLLSHLPEDVGRTDIIVLDINIGTKHHNGNFDAGLSHLAQIRQGVNGQTAPYPHVDPRSPVIIYTANDIHDIKDILKSQGLLDNVTFIQKPADPTLVGETITNQALTYHLEKRTPTPELDPSLNPPPSEETELTPTFQVAKIALSDLHQRPADSQQISLATNAIDTALNQTDVNTLELQRELWIDFLYNADQTLQQSHSPQDARNAYIRTIISRLPLFIGLAENPAFQFDATKVLANHAQNHDYAVITREILQLPPDIQDTHWEHINWLMTQLITKHWQDSLKATTEAEAHQPTNSLFNAVASYLVIKLKVFGTIDEKDISKLCSLLGEEGINLLEQKQLRHRFRDYLAQNSHSNTSTTP